MFFHLMVYWPNLCDGVSKHHKGHNGAPCLIPNSKIRGVNCPVVLLALSETS